MIKSSKMYVIKLKSIVRVSFLVLAFVIGFIFACGKINYAKLSPSNFVIQSAFATAMPSCFTSIPIPSVSFTYNDVLSAAIPIMRTTLNNGDIPTVVEIPDTPQVSETVLPPPIDINAEEKTFQTAAQNGYISSSNLYVNNDTPAQFDLEYLLNLPLPFSISKDDPSVLIVHTHTSESYTPTEQYNYIPTDTDRTEDLNFNVAKIGSIISDRLNEAGINTIHDSTINDYPSYSGSYNKTLGIIEDYIKKYPSIKVVLDIHRDAIVRSDGTKVKTVCNLGDVKSAQVMLVVGTNQSGLDHPHWANNFSFALKIQHSMNGLYADLARPINLRKQRFNQHTAPGALIVEVGSSGNTLEEAIIAAERFSDSLIEVLKQ